MKNGDGTEELKKKKNKIRNQQHLQWRGADACTATEVDTLQRLEKKHGI